VKAQFNLGYLYATGQGIPTDNTQAALWYRKAADQGHSGAKSNLSELLSMDHDPEGRKV